MRIATLHHMISRADGDVTRICRMCERVRSGLPGVRRHPERRRIPSRICPMPSQCDNFPELTGCSSKSGIGITKYYPIRGRSSLRSPFHAFPCSNRTQWLANGGSIPSRELLVCLILVGTGQTLGGGAEARTAKGESSRDLHAGPGELGSSDEAGRADGACRNTEDRQGRHCERSEMGGEGG